MDRTKTAYTSPKLSALEFDFDGGAPLDQKQARVELSGKDVLGIVQSAFDEIASDSRDLIDAKRAIFEQVAKGGLASALRAAIVAASRVHGTR